MTTERLRRARGPVLILLVVVLVALLGVLTLPKDQGQDYDPRNAAPSGSRALAQILGRQGVEVRRETTSTAVADAVSGAPGSATVLVTDPTLLGPDQLSRLAGTGADLVLLRPDAITTRALAPALRPAGSVEAGDADPECSFGADDTIPATAGRAAAGGQQYEATGTGTAAICYPSPDPAQRRGGSWAATTHAGHRVTLLGQGAILTNAALAAQGNAALALATLGGSDRLVWYLPDPLELGPTTSAPSLSELLPEWVWWVITQLLVALVLALVWRARRLGPLVAEPLPVVVRAAETQEGRARLYRRARARDQAAATLRTATLRRLAHRFDLPAGAGPAELAGQVAIGLDRPGPVVADVLLGPAPADDLALVHLATALDELEAALTGPEMRTTPSARSTGSSAS